MGCSELCGLSVAQLLICFPGTEHSSVLLRIFLTPKTESSWRSKEVTMVNAHLSKLIKHQSSFELAGLGVCVQFHWFFQALQDPREWEAIDMTVSSASSPSCPSLHPGLSFYPHRKMPAYILNEVLVMPLTEWFGLAHDLSDTRYSYLWTWSYPFHRFVGRTKLRVVKDVKMSDF